MLASTSRTEWKGESVVRRIQSCHNFPENTTFWFFITGRQICCNIPENVITKGLNCIGQLQDSHIDLFIQALAWTRYFQKHMSTV